MMTRVLGGLLLLGLLTTPAHAEQYEACEVEVDGSTATIEFYGQPWPTVTVDVIPLPAPAHAGYYIYKATVEPDAEGEGVVQVTLPPGTYRVDVTGQHAGTCYPTLGGACAVFTIGGPATPAPSPAPDWFQCLITHRC